MSAPRPTPGAPATFSDDERTLAVSADTSAAQPAIAYFGPSGTFTEMALEAMGRRARAYFPADARRIPTPSPATALAKVREGACDYAVVPIESSISGSVPATLDALVLGTPLQIYDEATLPIHFTVVGQTAQDLAIARSVGVYPVALPQVREWLERNVPHATVYTASSNAAAALDVRDGRCDIGITTAIAARTHSLNILADGVIDVPNTRTRFVLVGRPGEPPCATGHDRTSLVLMDVPNRPGSLQAVMQEFASRNINLSRIESRPVRTSFGTYWFHFDCVGHISEPAMSNALEALSKQCSVRFFGSWPVCAEAFIEE